MWNRGDLQPCLFSARFHCTSSLCMPQAWLHLDLAHTQHSQHTNTYGYPNNQPRNQPTIHPSIHLSKCPAHSIPFRSDSVAIPIPAHTKMPPASKRDTLSAGLLSLLLHLVGAGWRGGGDPLSSFPPILRRFASYFYWWSVQIESGQRQQCCSGGHWQHFMRGNIAFISGDIEFMLLATMLLPHLIHMQLYYSDDNDKRPPDWFVAVGHVCGPIFIHFLRAFFLIS